MTITWHGHYTLKIVSAETTVVVDPHSSDTGLAGFRGKANVVVLSNPSDPGMSNVSGVQGDFLLFNTPGEYSFNGITLRAVGWTDSAGHEQSMLRWSIEGMNIVSLGAIDHKPTDNELSELERTDVDLCIIPVGGGQALNAKVALDVVSAMEPRVVIPIHYRIPKLVEKLDSVDQFAKEMGVDPRRFEKRFSIRANRLPQEDMETVLLAP